jgi:hypothetical protein
MDNMSEQINDALSLLASATDLLNSWAREMGVQEARTENDIKGVINRLWDGISRLSFGQLESGLKAHHFVRMAGKDRLEEIKGNLDCFECSCGSEFETAEQLQEHQNLHLRIFLGIPEKPAVTP